MSAVATDERAEAQPATERGPLPVVRWFAWSVLALRLVVLDGFEIFRAKSINDYASFHFAALAIHDGRSPYEINAIASIGAEFGLPGAKPYIYPPLLAELLLPMSMLDLWPARVLWWLLNVASFAGSLLLLDRWLGDKIKGARDGGAARGLFAAAMALFWPLRESQWMGQVNAIVLLMLVLWWTQREKSPRAGAWLGFAMAIKMSPALLVLFVLSRRAWREAAIAASVGAGLVLGSCAVLGARGFAFFSSVTRGFLPGGHWYALNVPIDLPGNLSLAALSYALTGPHDDHLRLTRGAAMLQVALLVALLAVWGFRTLRSGAGDRSRDATGEGALAALTMLMIIAPTYAYEHHLAYATIAIAIAARLCVERRLSRAMMLAVLCAVAVLADPIGGFAPPANLLPRAVEPLWHCVKLLPVLVLFAATLFSRPQRPEADAARAT